VSVPRFSQGGREVGNVVWRIALPRTGTYYLWARARVASKGRGVFLVHLYQEKGRSSLYVRRWSIPRRDGWVWVPLDLNELGSGREPTPLHLPEGRVVLQLFAFSYDVRLDRLLITSDPHKKPSKQKQEGVDIQIGWTDRPG
jgi:hypothetical protein